MSRLSKIAACCSLFCALVIMSSCRHAPDPAPATEKPAAEKSASLSSMDEYMKIRSVMEPQTALHPASKELADWVYYIDWPEGVNQLFRKRADKLEALTDAVSFPEGMDYYRLSESGRYIAIGSDVGGDEQFDIYLLDLTDPKREFAPVDAGREVRADNLLFAKGSEKPFFVYRSNRRNGRDFDFYRFDIETRKSELLAELEGYSYLSDLEKERLIYTRHVGGGKSDIYLLDITKQTASPRMLSPQGREDGYYGAASFFDKDSILYVSDDKLEYEKLFKMDIASGKSELVADAGWMLESYALEEGGDHGAYVYNENGLSRMVIFDKRDGRELSRPEIGDGIINQLYFAENALYYVYSDPIKTTDIYRLDLTTMKTEQITQTGYGSIDPSRFVRPELVFYPTFDGRKIPAFIYRPKGDENKTAPFVIYAHGGPEGQFRPGFIRNVQFFVERGIGIMAPNVRGSSGYGREYLALDNCEKRMDSIKDYKAAADWLISSGTADPERLGINGGSYGGFVVMAAITEYPELFKAASSSVGIVNFITYFKNTKGYRRKVREKEYGSANDVELLKTISPIFKIDRVKTPLLIIHGANDPRVPVDEALQVEKALKERGNYVKALIFADEGHSIGKLKNRLKAYRAKADFFMEQFGLKSAEETEDSKTPAAP